MVSKKDLIGWKIIDFAKTSILGVEKIIIGKGKKMRTIFMENNIIKTEDCRFVDKKED